MQMFKDNLHLPVTCVDASEETLGKLQGVSDPEAKRKIIGAEFIRVFKEFKLEVEKRVGKQPTFLVQVRLPADGNLFLAVFAGQGIDECDRGLGGANCKAWKVNFYRARR